VVHETRLEKVFGDFTIADPEDPGTLDVTGFDAAVPSLPAGFARGSI